MIFLFHIHFVLHLFPFVVGAWCVGPRTLVVHALVKAIVAHLSLPHLPFRGPLDTRAAYYQYR